MTSYEDTFDELKDFILGGNEDGEHGVYINSEIPFLYYRELREELIEIFDHFNTEVSYYKKKGVQCTSKLRLGEEMGQLYLDIQYIDTASGNYTSGLEVDLKEQELDLILVAFFNSTEGPFDYMGNYLL